MNCSICERWFSSSDSEERLCPSCQRIQRTAKTNAGRIRAMSNEQLAQFISDCEAAGYLDGHITPKQSDGYHMDILEWLALPVKEG